MASDRLLRPALPLLLLTVAAACGDAPRPAEGPPAAGANPHAAMQAPQAVPASFAGRVVLRGEPASASGGFLMVSAVPKGSRLPLMSYLIPLDQAPPGRDGERIVPFRLDGSNDMMGGGGLPHDATGMELELSVRFDRDGKVESTEGDVTVAVPVTPDQSDIEVVIGA